MIDIRFVAAHGCWILAVAIVLAAFSYYQWLAKEQQSPLLQILQSERGWKLSVTGGLVLVASGLLLMEGVRSWQRGLWALVWAAAVFDWWRQQRRAL